MDTDGRAFRFFVEWDKLLAVAKQRGGHIRRSHKEGWVFFPYSGHPLDTLSNRERDYVRRCSRRNEVLPTLEELRDSTRRADSIIKEIWSGATVINETGPLFGRYRSEDAEPNDFRSVRTIPVAGDEEVSTEDGSTPEEDIYDDPFNERFEAFCDDIRFFTTGFAASNEDGWFYSEEFDSMDES